LYNNGEDPDLGVTQLKQLRVRHSLLRMRMDTILGYAARLLGKYYVINGASHFYFNVRIEL
jgi:hypothetical protein